MTRPRQASPQKQATRFDRPADLHPLLVETHTVWARSRKTATEAAREIGVGPGTIYNWMMGRGRPMFVPLDQMMIGIGHHYAILEGARPGATSLLDPARSEHRSRDASTLRRHETGPDLHPVIAEADQLWRATGIPLGEGATTIGLSRGPVYRWFLGTVFPGLLELDALLGTIGHRIGLVRGVRKGTPPQNAPR